MANSNVALLKARLHPEGKYAIEMARTDDVRAIGAIVSHPDIKAKIWDSAGDPAIPLHELIYYLLAKQQRHADGAVDDVTVGVVAFMPINSITWNPHIVILPEHRGCGTEAMQSASHWMFENSPCRKLVASPPAYNLATIRVFEKCGFSREGFSPKSFMFNGVLHDRVLMGKEKH